MHRLLVPSASPLTRRLGIFLATLRRIFEGSRHALTMPLEVAHHLVELLLRYFPLGVPLSEYLRRSVVSPPPVPSPVAHPQPQGLKNQLTAQKRKKSEKIPPNHGKPIGKKGPRYAGEGVVAVPLE